MQFKNSEIKAKINRPDEIKKILESLSADYKGCDLQTDTYFNIKNGRLKIREGEIENSLIHYDRKNTTDPTLSNISYTKVPKKNDIKDVLRSALGVLVEVKKARHIYFIDHVKFHIDHIQGLGDFIEIEVIDRENEYSEKMMHKLCKHYMLLLKVEESDLLTHSYSDMLAK